MFLQDLLYAFSLKKMLVRRFKEGTVSITALPVCRLEGENIDVRCREKKNMASSRRCAINLTTTNRTLILSVIRFTITVFQIIFAGGFLEIAVCSK